MIRSRFPVHAAVAATVVIALNAVAGQAGATTARLTSLGGGTFIEDDRNVLRWYGSLVDYPDQATIEAGHFTLPEGWHDTGGGRVSGPGAGVQLALDRAGRWGTAGLAVHDRGDDVDPGSLVRDRLGTTWTGIWARRVGDLTPAVMVRRGAQETAAATGTFGRERTRSELGLGLRWDLAAGAYLDLAGERRRHTEITSTADTAGGAPGALDRDGSGLGLRARAFLRLGEATALVPVLEFVDEDRPLPHASTTEERALRGHLLKLGGGVNWYPDPDHFLVLGLDYAHGRRDISGGRAGTQPAVLNSASWDAVGLTAGFESRFRYWLTFRGSFRCEAVSESPGGGIPDDDFTRFGLNLGAAIQLGRGDLDLTLSDREPRSVEGYWGSDLRVDPSTWLGATIRWRF